MDMFPQTAHVESIALLYSKKIKLRVSLIKNKLDKEI